VSDFQRLRPAISHYEELARAKHGAKFVESSKANFSEMQSKYYSKTDNPDYAGDTRKFCYLFKYAVAHGYYIYSALKMLRPKIRPAIFSRSPTRIACIGGGPGTEIIGLCRYLRETEGGNIKNRIQITVFDREPTWQESCERVLNCIAPDLEIDLRFQLFDATNPNSYNSLDFSGFHLVTANFFASEIRKAKVVGSTRAFWAYLFQSMGAGKIFLIVDFADTDGVGWKYVEGITPPSANVVLSVPALGMSCPDSKAPILALEGELDHRPKKNATNLIKAIIT
jgi:Putative SAM-dependent methyltransferase